MIGEELDMPPKKHGNCLLDVLVDLPKDDELAFTLALLPDNFTASHQRLLGDITIRELFIGATSRRNEFLEVARELTAVALHQSLDGPTVLAVFQLLVVEY